MRKIVSLIGLIATLFMMIFATNAQTEEQNIGYILHLAEAGIITPLEEEDTYLMMLTNTADFNAVVVTLPELFLFNYNL
ncbi:MAG TPA: hypothetical protein PLZ51_11175, partial [Aggregatilineales bacterium]|nr:hypothetical protein [Aggregatilineales bacterium]